MNKLWHDGFTTLVKRISNLLKMINYEKDFFNAMCGCCIKRM